MLDLGELVANLLGRRLLLRPPMAGPNRAATELAQTNLRRSVAARFVAPRAKTAMPRRSRASRESDQLIHEAFLSGLTPAQVAAEFEKSVEQVVAADRRVRAARKALDPVTADREAERTALSVLFRVALVGYQRSNRDLDLTTKATKKDAAESAQVQRGTKQKLADPRFLRIALFALAQQRALRSEKPPPAPPVDPKADPNGIRASIEEMKTRWKTHPKESDEERFQMYERMLGKPVPRWDLNDPMFDPRVPDKVEPDANSAGDAGQA